MCLLCCSTAGLRSGKYAEGLLKEGFTDVRNLEGSILAWVMTLPRPYNECSDWLPDLQEKHNTLCS